MGPQKLRKTSLRFAAGLLLILVVCGCASQWQRTELYMGLGRRGGANVSEAEFSRFVDQQVAPRFPDGFTIVPAEGRFLEDGRTMSEPSRLIIILHPRTPEADEKIQALSREYARQFGQDSVLRADAPSGVSFIGK
jgi:hypothetical protein